MKRINITLLILLISIASFAQNEDYIESLLTKHVLSCEDIEYNSMDLIPTLHRREATDTLNQLLIYSSSGCGYNNTLIHFSILYGIEQDHFNESLLNNYFLQRFVEQYRQHFDTAIVKYKRYYQRDYALTADKYYDFLKELATGLESRLNLSPKEKTIVNFYANPTKENYNRLANILKNTADKAPYVRTNHSYASDINYHYAAFAGLWIPTGKLNIAGNHPYIGGQLGISTKKMYFDFTVGVKFIKSPNTYYVNKGDSIFSSTYFAGGYVGVDAAYDLFITKRQGVSILGGFGWDGFQALNIEQKLSDERIHKTIGSLNFNAGLGYKLFIHGSGTYFGLDGKFNYLLHLTKNHDGTDFSGNTFTITFAIGGFSGGARVRH